MTHYDIYAEKKTNMCSIVTGTIYSQASDTSVIQAQGHGLVNGSVGMDMAWSTLWQYINAHGMTQRADKLNYS